MPAQLRDPRGQARKHLDRHGIDRPVDQGVERTADAIVRAGDAGVAVRVAARPDQDRLVGHPCLRHRFNRFAEAVAKILLGIVVDDSIDADAQVEDVDALGKDVFGDGLEVRAFVHEVSQRDGAVRPASALDRDRNHPEIGAPGDAPEPAMPFCRDEAVGVGPDDARHAGAVRTCGPGFILRHEEKLFRHVACEQRVIKVDPGVDEAHGHARAGRAAGSLGEVDMRVGAGRVDRLQPPLILEIVRGFVQVGKRLQSQEMVGPRQAAETRGRNAGFGQRWRWRHVRGRRARRGGPAPLAPRRTDEHQNDKDTNRRHRNGASRVSGTYGRAEEWPLRKHDGPSPATKRVQWVSEAIPKYPRSSNPVGLGRPVDTMVPVTVACTGVHSLDPAQPCPQRYIDSRSTRVHPFLCSPHPVLP